MENTLIESNIRSDPFDQFERWYSEVIENKIDSYNSMAVATVDASGMPSVRFILLKGFDRDGFVFYTNYTSEKAKELHHNPRACLAFYWKEIEKQVRIWGRVEKVSRKESEEYFHSRPHGSQLGAWASRQSSIIPDRSVLENRFEALRQKYTEVDGKVPLPDFWGGYRVIPEAFEFWQGRPSRLHDRIRYTKKGNSWEIVRLAP